MRLDGHADVLSFGALICIVYRVSCIVYRVSCVVYSVSCMHSYILIWCDPFRLRVNVIIHSQRRICVLFTYWEMPNFSACFVSGCYI